MTGSILTVCDLGPTRYAEGLALQERLVGTRAAGLTGDWLLYAEHEPVLTMGRGGAADSLIASRQELALRGIELHEVSRGGDVTWHGPGQLVGYPICHLDRLGRDLHAFLRGLEAVLVATLERFGIPAAGVPGRTGVWTGGRKIASIGIAVRRWVSYHGFALNVAPDLRGFGLIHPCGLRGIEMTSMAACLGALPPDPGEVRERVAEEFARHFGYSEVRRASADEARCGRAPSPAGRGRGGHHTTDITPALRRAG